MKKSKVILEKTAHFLCVNSEALTLRGLKGEMTFLYFLFLYGKQLKKQHYVDFAFEVLEGHLREILSQLQMTVTNHTFDLSMLEVGWSLQKFVAMGFFESDDMEEILIPFDEMAWQEAENLVSKQLSKKNLIPHILIANYLTDRLPSFEFVTPKSSTNGNYLEHIITTINNSTSLLKEYPIHLLPLNGLSYKNQNTYQMIFSLLFSKQLLPSEKENKKIIYNELSKVLETVKNLLRKDPQENYEPLLLKTILCGSFLLKDKTRQHEEFLAYCALHLLK